ncbi:MAG: hypothetical protein WDA75_13075, partial [Candidatus Latescibacterota bacterium]
ADLARHYERVYQRFPQYEKADQAAFNAATFYTAAGDTAAALVVLEDVSRRFPRSPWREEIYRRRLSLLAQADPPRARDLADSLISGALVVSAYRQPELRRWTPALLQTGILPQSRAYTLRLDQCLAAGDTAGALALVQRLIAASLPDPFPYLYAGQRLRRLGRPALPVLEAGLAQVAVERLLALPGIPDPWSAAQPPPLRAHYQAQDRERVVLTRVQYLLELGECGLEAGLQALAATRLREADKLLDELVQLDPPEKICLSLGRALARAGQGKAAERSLLRLVWFYYSHPEAELELARIHQARYGHTRFLAQRLAELWPQAPPFALVDVLGEPVSLAGWAGRPILIYCGNPGEGPRHQAEQEALDRWQRIFGPQGLEVLYVSDFGELWAQGQIRRGVDWLRQVRQQGGFSFHFAVDDEDALRGLPLDSGVLLLVDRSGRLRLRWWYERWESDAGQQQVAHKLSEIIAERPGPALAIGGNQ